MCCHTVNLGWMTIIKNSVDCRASPVTWRHPHVPVDPRPARTNCVWLAGSHSLIPLPPPFLKSVFICFPSHMLLFIYPRIQLFIHPSIPSFISSFSLCLAQQCAVENQIACILSVCLSLHLCHKSWIKSWIKGTISGFYVHPWHH